MTPMMQDIPVETFDPQTQSRRPNGGVVDGPPVEPQRHTAAWPDPPAKEAFYGPAGDFVNALDPHTEADPAAILIRLLVAFGNAGGRGPHFIGDGVKQYSNLNMVRAGLTSKGRKGTSWGRVRGGSCSV